VAIDNFFAKFAPDDQPEQRLEPGFGSGANAQAQSFDDLTPTTEPMPMSTPTPDDPTQSTRNDSFEPEAPAIDTLLVGASTDTVAQRDFGSSLGMRVERLTKKRSLRLLTLLISTGVPALIMVILSGFGIWSWRSGRLDQYGYQASEFLHTSAVNIGLTIDGVQLSGRFHTDIADVQEAIGAHQGAAILSIDPLQIKKRLETLPWVESAKVERILPSQLSVSLTERKPIAIWQNNGLHRLIDRNGVEIVGASIEPFAGYLPVVTGRDAPEHASELIAILTHEPQLYEQTLAATRVGNRRWDLTLIGDVIVMLPDTDVDRAWSILAEAQRRGRLLDRAINRVDLRASDRIVVTATDPENAEQAGFNVTDLSNADASSLTDA